MRSLHFIFLTFLFVTLGHGEWEVARAESVLSNASSVLGWKKDELNSAEIKRFAKSCKNQIENLGFKDAHPVWALIGVLATEIEPAYNELARQLIKTYTSHPDLLQKVTGYSWGKQAADGLNYDIYCAVAGHPSWSKPGSFDSTFQANKDWVGLLQHGCCPGIQAIAASYWNMNPLTTFEPILFGRNDTPENRTLRQTNWRYWRAGFLGRNDLATLSDDQKLQLLFGASCSKARGASIFFGNLLPKTYDQKQNYLAYNSALFGAFDHTDALINLRPENMYNRDIVTDSPFSSHGGGNIIYARDLESNVLRFPAVTLHNLIDVFVKNNQISPLRVVVCEIVRRASTLKITPAAGQKIDQTERDNAKWLCEAFQQAWRTAAQLNNMQAMGILAKNFGKLKGLGIQVGALGSYNDSLVQLGQKTSNNKVFASSALEAAVDGCSVDAFAALVQAGADVETLTRNEHGLKRPIAAYVALRMVELIKQVEPLPSETNLEQLLSFIRSESIASHVADHSIAMTTDMRNLLARSGADVRDWDAKIHHAQNIQDKRLALFLSVMKKLTMPESLSTENKQKMNNYIVMLLLLEKKQIDVQKALFDASLDRISQRDELAFLKFLSDVFLQAKLANFHFGEVIGLALPEAAQKVQALSANPQLLQLQ